MRFKARLKRDWRFWQGLNRTLKRVKSIARDSGDLLCDDLQAAVDRWRNERALTFEGRTLTYGEMDAMANRYAHWAKGLGLRRGQTVALFMPNRLEYFPVWYGLSKVGVVTALINNQLVVQYGAVLSVMLWVPSFLALLFARKILSARTIAGGLGA